MQTMMRLSQFVPCVVCSAVLIGVVMKKQTNKDVSIKYPHMSHMVSKEL